MFKSNYKMNCMVCGNVSFNVDISLQRFLLKARIDR